MLLTREIAAEATTSALDGAIDQAQAALLAKQDPTGFWVGELQGDSILESEYILFKFILGQENDAHVPKVAKYLRSLQQADGGWNVYPGGAADLSGSVKAYFALKLMGDDPNSPAMRAAASVCRRLGGAEKCNSFSKFYLAALGQISYDACPSIPPEIVFLPRWCYFNLYNVSAWTRAMILPLSLATTLRPIRSVGADRGIKELYLDMAAANRIADPPRGLPRSWREIFLRADQVLKIYETSPHAGVRQRAIDLSLRWLIGHIEDSEGLAAIFPSMVYMLIVFRSLGYPEDHPLVQKGHKELRDFFIEEDGAIRIQPCVSPVWDTGIALHALAETEIEASDPQIEAAVDWLLAKECRIASDWAKKCPQSSAVAPGGWYFEFSNPHYPDVDDTAMVTMSLTRLGGRGAAPAAHRGLQWLLAMQNSDGGWAAFDRTESRPILEKIPFADHNAMQDPSCPDIAGRTLECLGHCGLTVRHHAVERAVDFIRREQDESGGWWGRWGVNYIYGTWQVLAGLRAVKQDMKAPWVCAAGDWLRSCQKQDGSWGETPGSYDDGSLKGTGPSTASQTAWGVMGVMAAAGAADPAVKRGIEWLVRHQGADGNWEENFHTGTGFPRVFYLKYHLYRLYFPLMALARYRRLSA